MAKPTPPPCSPWALAGCEVFDTRTGEVLQNYIAFGSDSSGSYSGIAYSPDGKYLVFSQDSSHVTIANVSTEGLLSDDTQVSVPPNSSFIKCFPNSPPAAYAQPLRLLLHRRHLISRRCRDLERWQERLCPAEPERHPRQNRPDAPSSRRTGKQIRVGNAPHSIVIDATATPPTSATKVAGPLPQADFQVNSAGTEIVADPVNGSAITGTVSVVNLATMKVKRPSRPACTRPAWRSMAVTCWSPTPTATPSRSSIPTTNEVKRTINLGLPIKVPGQRKAAYGAAPDSIAVDAKTGIAYVALYNANAIAVVDLNAGAKNAVLGMIPVAYAPSSVVLNKADSKIIVANDKGVGTLYSFETDHGVTDYNTHQDNGTVSIVPVPNSDNAQGHDRAGLPEQPLGSHGEHQVASGGTQDTSAVAIPAQNRRSFADQARVPDHP